MAEIGKVSLFGLVAKQIKFEKSDLTIVLIYAIVIGMLSLITPLAVQELVNIIAFGVLIQPLLVLTTLFVSGLLLTGVFRICQRYVIELIQQRLFVNNAFELVGRMRSIKRGALDSKQVNWFMEVINLQKSYAKLLIDGLSAVLQIIIGLGILCFYHPFFFALNVFIVTSFFFIVYWGGKGGVKTGMKESHYKYELIHWLQEATASNDVFKLIGNSEFLNDKTNQINLNYVESRNRHFSIIIRQNILSILLQTVAAGILLALGGWLVIQGDLTLGQLIAAELVLAGVLVAIDKFIGSNDSIFGLLIALVKLDFLKTRPIREISNHKIIHYAEKGLKLECRNLHFEYTDHDGNIESVLKGVDLTVEPSEWILIDGPRGSGKSTLMNILCGLDEAHKGFIYLDETEIAEIDLATLGQIVEFVKAGREFILEGSIADNILLGRKENTIMRKALQISGLEEEIENMPAGLKSKMQSKGINFSESQVFRILIARALVESPRLLLIDEGIFNIFDEELKIQILDGLANGLNFKPTVVFFGSDDLIQNYVDKKYILKKGKLELKP